MAVIELENVSRVYRSSGGVETSALRDLSLQVEAGEFLAVMGPSGSGKSTLMNVIGLGAAAHHLHPGAGRAGAGPGGHRARGADPGDRPAVQPELSGGQMQRVAIARALLLRPSIILADEPTGNLDSRTAADVMALLAELHQEGATIVLITHEHDVAEYAQRAVELQDGRVRTSEGALA